MHIADMYLNNYNYIFYILKDVNNHSIQIMILLREILFLQAKRLWKSE